MMANPEIWPVIIGLAIGTYIIRFSFFGIIGDRPIPRWFERSLKYVGVGILPGLVAPFALWPDATGGEVDPARLVAACVALFLGIRTRNVFWAILGGFLTLYILLYSTGQF